jgi:predicted amidohydrolase
MKIAVWQFAPAFGEVRANVERIAGTTLRRRADLWVLPELATTGYLFSGRAECRDAAEPIPGPTTDALAAACRRRGTRLVLGLAERAGRRVYNSAAYVGPRGVIGVYRKVHLFDREFDWFDPGPDPFRTWPLGRFRLGMMVCFDWVFPEAARSLALRGADVVAHPANLVLPYCQAAMATRSLENGVFSVTANRVGRERRGGVVVRFTGRSQVVDPRGRVLASADETSETVLTVDIDPRDARRKALTDRNDRLGDRRPELYAVGTGKKPQMNTDERRSGRTRVRDLVRAGARARNSAGRRDRRGG